MHFGLSEEQELLQETVRGFVAAECPPEKLRQLFDDASGFDAALWQGLSEIGIAGLAVDEAYGGAGMDWLELALVSEIVGAGGLPVPLFGHALACLAIARGGSEAQKQRWLPRLASGDLIGAVALGEEEDRWEPEEWQVAFAKGALEGRKQHATDVHQAAVFVVGTVGGGLVLVERDAAGLEIEPTTTVDHTRQIGELVFDGTPAEALGGGASLAAQVRDAGLVLLAADAFGAGWKLVELTNEYAKTRQQFGEVIAQFQAVKHQIVDMATQLEPARGLFWYAGHAVDHIPAEAARSAAIAKAHITDVAATSARAAVELHGGLGFTWECDVHIHMKRVMFDRVFLGTPEHQWRRIATQEGW